MASIMTMPRWKRLILPLWNGGYHASRWLGDVALAIRYRRIERCPACGRVGLMFYRRRLIVPELERRWGLTPRLAEAFARKESMDCSRCGVKLRGRRLARVLLELYPVGASPQPARSVADWVTTSEARALRVVEINRVEGLHEVLAALPFFESSDYRDGASPGAVVDGVRSEDLTRLTYADASFDLVITSETLEHVPDLDAGLREIRRILKPGGRHVFTIPQLPETWKTFARATLDGNGTKVDLAPPISHPGGDSGYPVFTEFGQDFPEILRNAGFEVEVHYGPNRDDDVAQVYVARK
jgi:SAM-dependent methyltransferase